MIAAKRMEGVLKGRVMKQRSAKKSAKDNHDIAALISPQPKSTLIFSVMTDALAHLAFAFERFAGVAPVLKQISNQLDLHAGRYGDAPVFRSSGTQKKLGKSLAPGSLERRTKT